MASSPPPPPPPPERRDPERGPGQQPTTQGRMPRWVWFVVLGLLAALLFSNVFRSEDKGDEISFREFVVAATDGSIEEAEYNNNTGDIKGTRTEGAGGSKFHTTGPNPLPEQVEETLRTNIPTFEFHTPRSSIWASILPLLIPVALIFLIFWWFQRRAQGQMSGIMSIGRSKAKTYTTERPGTTFEDVAGYEGVKKEIVEVVDFLKHPDKFAQIGARIPKGVLLVGPPGTGKTLIARAVAGEAGVPFLSVTGSDFMEMFVGVGASRVRDLFQSARKMGRAIIFIDEIDSIGRKRGAGLGGGHDEREQTLNQMLAEMDGFEATEGIVMMAATNRPDILDPALLRPGRFDRQVVVPLPEADDRLQILNVHVRSKKIAADVDLPLIARGSPGMSGADLANLVNEAALFAVRSDSDQIRMIHFENARDRVLMGQRRESMVMSEEERQITAYHEAGHAVCAAVLPHADPLHKVTIIPRGMALGVTMTLPEEDRHTLRRNYLDDMLVMRMGGRIAEELVFGVSSSGAADDLAGATEFARRMVREWGMSDRIGPMAWRSAGQVFLGDEMMTNREYSDETARVIDEEVAEILRTQENRCREVLSKHRNGLDLVARALLEHETISGDEVGRLVQLGDEGPIGDPRDVIGAALSSPSTGGTRGSAPTTVASTAELEEPDAPESWPAP
ncbi:MAG: ATP-dependent zinc metalloprotease FtsH [Acidimicrobiia bacterium]|nr:ATP-dependent zinc metalloprotease FtsH [bacterium]MXZ85625.1 ATP-dependent zinc metalloprotease FtsH [Acidimicrobiia bacterium]MYB10228.1 ATP-dependent zinc metalloprotease FtsH [Acidimicrobiia bacterium]MYG60063.1 ATP-dependent zinc metalloprotease FtsH [Acidimicrobiia bacterium]MYG73003.1 ATP-dependent zinc metalloprotease FtsH [Acidimicrobiia bacterium]